MPKNKTLSIPQTFLLYIVVFFVASTLLTSTLFLYYEYKAFENKSKESELAHIETQKKLIQKEVDQVIEHLTISRNIRINQINEHLTYRVDQAYTLAENIYTENIKRYSEKVVIEIIREALRPLRSKEIRGDYFIIKTDGEEILYPSHPEFEGTNFLNLPDSPEKSIVQQEVNIALKYGKGFIREKVTGITPEESFTSPSVIYVRLFKPLNIIIGTGEYTPDIERDIKKEAIRYIKNIHYGVNQKIFINTVKGEAIIASSKQYKEGDNILNLKDESGFGLIRAEIKASQQSGGGFTSFDWINDDTNQVGKCISFVKFYPKWNWVIGAWFDLSLFESDVKDQIEHMQKAQIKKASNIMIIIILIHLILLLIFRYVTHKTKKNTTTFIHLLKKAIQSNSNINQEKLNYSEFQTIADATNKIIENKRRADEKLEKSELQFKSLFEIAPIMICGFNDKNEITLWNKECERVIGYSLDEIKNLNNPFKTLIKNTTEYNFIIENITNPSRHFNEFTLTSKSHEQRSQFWAGFTTPSNTTIGVGYDTTQLKKTLTELNITANKLKEANLTKDKFLSIIAHDLKNPFNAIIGFSNILADNYNEFDDETKLELIKDIQHSAKLNFSLLEKMLEWAMSQSDQISFKPESLIVHDMIQNSISFASYQANQKQIKLHSSDYNDLSIFADENMLMSLLRNLISNAIKFTPEQGQIYIYAEDCSKQFKISIKDTGVGMSENDIDKLFRIDAKVQTQGTQEEKGTGLGLLICKEFVDKHKGEIEVKSKLGEGSEFIISLPKSDINN